MIESQLFSTYILASCSFCDVVFIQSFLSEIPEKMSESFLSEVVFPKLFCPKVFNFDVFHYFPRPFNLISVQMK